MNRANVIRAIALFAVCVGFASCEGCVRKTAEKVTEMGLSAVDGVADAISNRGEETAKRLTDALGRVVVGTLKSVEEQLAEHVASVEASPDRIMVAETTESLDPEVINEYYDPLAHVDVLDSGVTVSFIGKLTGEPVVDAVISLSGEGTFDCGFEYLDAGKNVLFTSDATLVTATGGYQLVSYALSDAEQEQFGGVSSVKITVKKI